MLLTFECIAVLDVGLPVTSLPVDIESKTSRTLHCCQPSYSDLCGFVAPKAHIVLPLLLLFIQIPNFTSLILNLQSRLFRDFLYIDCHSLNLGLIKTPIEFSKLKKLLSESESVKFSLIESVIYLLTDSSVKKIFFSEI